MTAVFLKAVNMSIAAGWLILAVVLLRPILKRAPKWINVVLWGIVALRLIMPFTLESSISLIPSAETVPQNIEMSPSVQINSGIGAINSVINPIIAETSAPNPTGSANPHQIYIPIFANIWLLGAMLMLAYTVFSYIRLHGRLHTAVRLKENIYQSENAASPFVFGLLKPKIYLPYNMDQDALNHVIAHEKAHISRRDHLWKPLGFLILTVYWFNPLVWVAYVLLCRDIELACDERVIRELENTQKADYTQALLSCSINRRAIAACPLAFGEVGVKQRVKSVLSYKKPAFWIIIVSLALCVFLAVFFLTDPVKEEATLNVLSLSETEKLPEEQMQSLIYGISHKDLHKAWGQPQGHGSGVWLDIWKLSDGNWLNVYYDAEGKVEFAKISDPNADDKKEPILQTFEGTVTGMYTWDKNGETVEMISLEVLNDATYSFALSKNTDYRQYFTDSKTYGKSDKNVLVEGAYAKIECESRGEKNTALVVTVLSSLADAVTQYRLLIMDELKDLVKQNGESLGWEHFSGYIGRDIGSGLYIMKYDIDSSYYLLIGGVPTLKPMYIRLVDASNRDRYIDVRYEDIDSFISRR